MNGSDSATPLVKYEDNTTRPENKVNELQQILGRLAPAEALYGVILPRLLVSMRSPTGINACAMLRAVRSQVAPQAMPQTDSTREKVRTVLTRLLSNDTFLDMIVQELQAAKLV